MPAIDNTQFLEAIHGVLATGDQLVETLNASPNLTPEGEMLVGYVTTVVSTQADIIRKLVESQMTLTDKIDDIVTRYNL